MLIYHYTQILQTIISQLLVIKVILLFSQYSFFILSLIIDFFFNLVITNASLIKIFETKNVQIVEENLLKKGIVFSFILVGLSIPILEEFLFRYKLTSFIWNYKMLPLKILIIIIQLFNIRNVPLIIILISFILLFSHNFYIYIINSTKYKMLFLRFYDKNYWLFFFSSAITFGVLHMGNYQLENFIPVLSIIFVLPQVVAGLFLGYIRIIMGLRWSILFHALHNSFLVALLFINT